MKSDELFKEMTDLQLFNIEQTVLKSAVATLETTNALCKQLTQLYKQLTL